ncbi:MAG: amidohydrolase family protein [Acidimicrobiales bacterium]
MLDLLIRGGTVVDGTGGAPTPGDIGVAGGRIVEVDPADSGATTTIEADGLLVAPGFVDLHSHYDAQLFWDPTLSPSPLHGVTTAVSGNCGLTLAPAAPPDRDFLSRLLARVEAIPVEALLAGVTYEWESFAQLLDVIAAKPLALNLGLMVGHSAIRRAIMGPAASTDRADSDQIGAMCTLLGQALAAGGLGFSTANVATQVDGDGRPTPPNLAEPEEFIALATECGLHPGTSIEFIPGTFLQGFSDADMALMADMSAAANRHLNWNTPLINRASPDLYKRQLRATDVAEARGGRVVPMFMPQNGPLRHDFKEAYVFRAIPGWADVFALEGEARIRALADPDTRSRLKAAVDGPSEGLPVVVRNWAGYEVNDIEDPKLAHLVGRTIAQLAAERDVTPFDAMLDVVVAAGLEVGFVRYQYPEDEWTAAARLEVLKDPRVVLGASDAGAHGEMMVGADFPTRCIGELVRDKEIFTIESMIQQFCDVPARLYGLVDRGRIAPGMWADIVVFDLDRVGAGPMERVSDLPAGATRLTTRSTGVEHVLTAGTEVVRHGEFTGRLPGQLLRSGRDTTTVTAN